MEEEDCYLHAIGAQLWNGRDVENIPELISN
jgi:hypothetical protein